MVRLVIITVITLFYTSTLAVAQPVFEDKRSFSFTHPTPRHLWRELSADRPDFTESPYTVDAGAVQLEMSFFDYAKNGNAETWSVAPVNLKVGLLNHVDIQFVFDPYVRQDDGSVNEDGLGDTQFRLKINFWGNDGGDTAFGIMPFIKIPTAGDGLGNDHVEGGVIFPFAVDLTDGVGLGLMFEIDFVFDENDDAFDTEFVLTAAIGFDLTDKLGVYVEGISITSTDPGINSRGLVGIGVTYALQDNLVLDVGVNLGLTGNADDVNLFSGITIRY